ncbi:MAG: ABC transporter permease, partial [Candidatus Izemoplasmatales bacterium]
QSSGFYTGYGDFYQGEMNYSWSKRVDMFPYLVNNFDGLTLTYGEYPTAEGEIAIDEWVVDQMLDNNMYGSLGASEYKDFLGMTVADNMGSNYTVVGIIQTESPIFILPVGVPYYGDSNGMYMSFMPKNDLLEYEILYGHDLQSSGEVLLSEFDWIVQEAENPADVIGQDYPYDTNYTIAGIYRSESMYVAIVSLEDYRDAVLSQRIEYAKTDWAIWEGYSTTLLFYTNDMDQAIQHLTDLGYTATDVYSSSKETYMANRFDQYAGQLRFIFISLAGIGVYVFLMMRSSMLSRIKEIGIYRAIGATKRDIYKIFLSEIIAFTTVGSMIGYVLVSATVWQVQHQLLSWGLAAADLYFPLPYFLGGAAIIFLVNILFGLLPIFNLLRKTPSEILAKYDI